MKSKNTFLVVSNSISLIIMLFANYASSAGIFSKMSVADISHKYDTLFAPAGYAFIIWGFLFLLAISFVVNQWLLLKEGDSRQYIKCTGIWFTVSNLANSAWLYFWTNEMIGISVMLILCLLVSLVILTIKLRLELDDKPVRIIFFVWWPISFYLGWIMVATIACIASWLVSIGWNGNGISQNIYTIIMITTASLIYVLLIIRRNMREAAVVGMWSFLAIAIRQWNTNNDIAVVAIAVSCTLIIASSIHAYKNRKYNIDLKLKRGEW